MTGDDTRGRSELILYQTEDGRTRIQCRFESDTVWLTQAQMAELFQTTAQNITQHLKDIFAEGELDEEATCKSYLQFDRKAADRSRGACVTTTSTRSSLSASASEATEARNSGSGRRHCSASTW